MKLGIVGLPNVGKSTLFNAITSTKNAEAANYPFCTIEPNSGIVAVPDKRLDKLAEVWQTNKKTPAIVEFVDIAGLVKGASQGAGLGNKFLGHIRECDAIVHVVRCFDDDNIIHVVEDVSKAEAVDPISDIDAIDYELILSDLEVVQNRAGRMAKAAKSGNNKGAAAEAAWLQQLADHLSAGKPARSFDFDEGDAEQQAVLHEMGLFIFYRRTHLPECRWCQSFFFLKYGRKILYIRVPYRLSNIVQLHICLSQHHFCFFYPYIDQII